MPPNAVSSGLTDKSEKKILMLEPPNICYSFFKPFFYKYPEKNMIDQYEIIHQNKPASLIIIPNKYKISFLVAGFINNLSINEEL